MILAGLPLPERPRSLDEANDRGFDSDSARWDAMPADPLDEQWQAWLDRSVVAAQHRRDESLDDDRCGTRCDTCDERMCSVNGPEPRPCGVTCADCRCECTKCLQQREDMRDELLGLLEREARG